MSLFITCPVQSVEHATAFYTALGWTLNPEMSDHNVSCFAIAAEQYVMLGSHEMYAGVEWQRMRLRNDQRLEAWSGVGLAGQQLCAGGINR